MGPGKSRKGWFWDQSCEETQRRLRKKSVEGIWSYKGLGFCLGADRERLSRAVCGHCDLEFIMRVPLLETSVLVL